jgi:L-lysine 2,3-aminomutase
MSCSGCARELTAEPLAICPNVIHWRAWSEALQARIKDLESALHEALVQERELEARARSADCFVLAVSDGLPGEIDVCDPDDGHSHHYVPSSSLIAIEAELTAERARTAELRTRLETAESRGMATEEYD